jgi:hypothetical protein
MSISGTMLNHPEIISEISVPKMFIPKSYYTENWNRSSLINLKYSKKNINTAFLGGYEGIWKTTDGGKTFVSLNNNGFPNSLYYRKTKSIYLLEDSINSKLLAGTFGGLYILDINKNVWSNIKLNNKNEKIVKILEYKDSLIVFTSSSAFITPNSNKLNFKLKQLFKKENETKLTILELFFLLHNGELWGLPGKLLFDAVGIIIVFLSFSGIYLWLIPKSNKFKIFVKNNAKQIKWKLFNWLYKYHLKLGIWSFVVMLIIAFTGLFLRPPMMVMIMDGEIPISKIPFFEMENPWENRIRNAMYDKSEDRLIIDAKDGYWVNNVKNQKEFERESPPVPIFAMGATVMEQDDNGDYLIGSFAGLFKVNYVIGKSTDAITGSQDYSISNIRPGSNLITGYFKNPFGQEFITTHFQGLQPINRSEIEDKVFKMPRLINSNFRMPFWNYLFELHNGRIFQSLTGDFYLLIIPLGSLIFLMVLITGLFDWLYLKYNYKKTTKINKSRINYYYFHYQNVVNKSLQKLSASFRKKIN